MSAPFEALGLVVAVAYLWTDSGVVLWLAGVGVAGYGVHKRLVEA